MSLGVSYFVTISTIAVCFIDQEHPKVCEVIPGYSQSVANNEMLLEQFKELQLKTRVNDKRLDKLESEK